MNEKDNKTFFEDLPKELQKEFADKFNHYCETLKTENINGKDYIVIDELTQLNTNMIQPNELRIGNWVYDTFNDVIVKVIGIKEYNGHCLWEKLNGKYLAPYKSLNPIPLTEELIEKQGWEKVGYYYTDKNGLEIYETNDGWLLHIDDDKCQTAIGILVKSVHELQNAYFIATKKELEIKL